LLNYATRNMQHAPLWNKIRRATHQSAIGNRKS
jgi:hypothetical protein